MANKVVYVHIQNRDESHGVTFDRRSDDLKHGHMNTYEHPSKSSVARLLRADILRGSSIVLYPTGWSLIWVPTNTHSVVMPGF